MVHLLEPLQYVWNALTSERSPRRIGWGLALGLWLGLIPKGNLVAWSVGCLLLATRVNLGVGMLTAMLVTAAGSMVDPLTHGIGRRLLQLELIQRTLIAWHDAPLVPWLRLNNTVVLGSSTLGFLLLHPVQHISTQIATLVQRWLSKVRKTAGDRKAVAEIPASEPAPQLPPAVEQALSQVAVQAKHTTPPPATSGS